MSDIEAQVEKINARMFHRRLKSDCSMEEGWNVIELFGAKIKARDVIREHLMLGHAVTSGWYATSVRGFHRHQVMWKERTNAR